MKPAQVHSWSLKKETKGIVIEFENISMLANEGLSPEGLQVYFYPGIAVKKEVITIVKKMLEEYEEEKKILNQFCGFICSTDRSIYKNKKSRSSKG